MPFNILMIVKRMFNLTFNYHLTMDIKPQKREISDRSIGQKDALTS